MIGKTACWKLLLMILLLTACDVGHAQVVREQRVVVVINEVQASNDGTIRDPQGQYEDWIELYNAGQSAVDVGGCYLTDDLARPTKWQIPTGNAAATTIPVGGYLLIWADGDVDDAGLHASFRLGSQGEEVGLFASDGAELIDSLSYGSLYTDVSYGRYPDGGSDLRVLAVPSPGAANQLIYEGVVAPPQFDVTSRVCTGPITVTLTTETP
ncbi:MAG: lamin tail domain-containing protein, partial [Solirubrobacterales bacterium]